LVDVSGNSSNGDRITLKNIVLADVNAAATGINVYTDQSCTNNDLYSLDAIKVSTSCATPINLGNVVWYDANNNGIKDASEVGIVGATVKLYNDDNGDNVPDGAAIATTTTGSTGLYSFVGLAAGKYIVGVTIPAGYTVGSTTATSTSPDNNTDNDNNGVTLTSTEIRSNYIALSVGGEPASGVDGDGTNGNLTLDFGLSLNTSGPCSGAFNPTYTAQGYDLFIQQGLTLVGGHTDGAVATGGNLTLNGSSVLSMNNAGSYPMGYDNDNNYTLVVGGRINYTSGGISYVNNGTIKVANTTGSTVWSTDPNGASVNLKITSNASTGWTGYNSTPAVQLNSQQDASTVTTPPSALDFTNAFSAMVSNATIMSGYSASSPCSASLNIITLTGTTPSITLAANKINVVNITGTAFDAITQITFTNAPTATSPLIFNINQTTSSAITSYNASGIANTAGKYIIYNFYNNTGTITVNASNTLVGSIFAPSAPVPVS
jgi:choice-of-anchor A domain-containing protein